MKIKIVLMLLLVVICGCGSTMDYITGGVAGVEMERAKNEMRTKENLRSIRNALEVFYNDFDGKWPKDLEELVPKYIREIPQETVSGSNRVRYYFEGSGGWFYDTSTGKVSINLIGYDLKGKKYSEY